MKEAFLSYHMDCNVYCSLLHLYIGLLIPDPSHILNMIFYFVLECLNGIINDLFQGPWVIFVASESLEMSAFSFPWSKGRSTLVALHWFLIFRVDYMNKKRGSIQPILFVPQQMVWSSGSSVCVGCHFTAIMSFLDGQGQVTLCHILILFPTVYSILAPPLK